MDGGIGMSVEDVEKAVRTQEQREASHRAAREAAGTVEMLGVREHGEGYGVDLAFDAPRGRVTVMAYNEAGYRSTSVDLLELLAWLRANRPDLLEGAGR